MKGARNWEKWWFITPLNNSSGSELKFKLKVIAWTTQVVLQAAKTLLDKFCTFLRQYDQQSGECTAFYDEHNSSLPIEITRDDTGKLCNPSHEWQALIVFIKIVDIQFLYRQTTAGKNWPFVQFVTFWKCTNHRQYIARQLMFQVLLNQQSIAILSTRSIFVWLSKLITVILAFCCSPRINLDPYTL